jgi:dTDP-4-dehydrorhamnose 3,5-epimerase
MELTKTKIPGCFEIHHQVRTDHRGKLVKAFSEESFREMGLHTNFPEVYYSVSDKNVLRGLHFQMPSEHHIKIVLCLQGALLDAVVDLRVGSPTFGQHILIELNSDKSNMLYVPEGCAHGFYTLTKNTIFLNQTSTVYSQEHDMGIHWNSCGIEWPTKNPVLSKKDTNAIDFGSFNSPFTYPNEL